MKRVSLFLLILFVIGCRPAPPDLATPSDLPEPVAAASKVPSPYPSTLKSATPQAEDLEAQIAAFEQEDSSAGASVVTTRSRPVRVTKPQSNLPLKLPGFSVPGKTKDSELQQLSIRAESSGSAADWRQVAERALVVQDFHAAQVAFDRESSIYENKGFIQAALAEKVKAAQYATELEFYVPSRRLEEGPRARLEPERGCLVGAFIDRDDNLATHFYQSQTHGDIADFNRLTQKKHASFFMYRAFGMLFPTEWAEYVKSEGAMVHIAWEPKSVEEVFDEDYVREFMQAARELDHPVMLRFASEMNGEWTGYNGDPEAYIKAFRFIYEESRRAPKVALMWCPNAVPQASIKDYYPGDDYVDWVGVNFYSVPFMDNNPKRPGDKIHPTDHLRYVYEAYAGSKPIAIGEWAASHQSSLVKLDLTSFGTTKLAQLYGALPTRYPRVKMVNWYDCNNIVHARAERKLNNFQLTGSDKVLDFYRRAVAQPHYLGSDESAAEADYKLVTGPVRLGAQDEIRLFLKSYDPFLKAYFSLGDQVIHASSDPLSWYVTSVQLAQEASGKLEVVVLDSQDRFVTRASISYSIVEAGEI